MNTLADQHDRVGADASPDSPVEAELVAAAVAGDGEAFRALYEANLSCVFGYLASRVGRQDAEDLTAEVFSRAFAAIGRFERRGVPIRAWLLRIAHNLVIGRARRRQPILQPLDDESGYRSGDRAPDEHVELAWDARGVRKALSLLPEGQRTVLELRFLYDLSVGEAAAVLGSSDEAIRALTYRALRNLRRTFEAER